MNKKWVKSALFWDITQCRAVMPPVLHNTPEVLCFHLHCIGSPKSRKKWGIYKWWVLLDWKIVACRQYHETEGLMWVETTLGDTLDSRQEGWVLHTDIQYNKISEVYQYQRTSFSKQKVNDSVAFLITGIILIQWKSVHHHLPMSCFLLTPEKKRWIILFNVDPILKQF